MTNQDKKNYLKSFKSIDMEINRLLEEKTHWMGIALKVTPCYSDMPKKPSCEIESPQKAIDMIIDIEKSIDKKVDELASIKDKIECAIDLLDSNTLKLLLKYRYINCYTWEKIAVIMNYDYRWVLRLHGRALNQLTIESHY